MAQQYDFKNGDVCYDSLGIEYMYQAPTVGGHIVCAVLEIQGSYDEPPYTEFGEPTFRTHIFPSAPTQKRHEDIARIDREIVEKRAELNAIKAESIQFEKDAKTRMVRLKQHKALENIDRILDGGVTHYVITGSYPKILAVEDTKSDYEPGKLRMLSFQVTINRATKQTGWYLHQYADGSGNGGNEVIPCFSLEEAIEKIKVVITQLWDEWTPDKSIVGGGYPELVKISATYGVSVPEAYTNAKREADIKEAKRVISLHEAALEKAENLLKVLTDA